MSRRGGSPDPDDLRDAARLGLMKAMRGYRKSTRYRFLIALGAIIGQLKQSLLKQP